MKTTIHACGEVWGVHRWPDAKRPVDFLALPHAHRFTLEAEVEVGHNDRELEFILLGRYLESQVRKLAVKTVRDSEDLIDLDARSCENIAHALAVIIQDTFGRRWVKVTVREDGLNGASVELMSAAESREVDAKAEQPWLRERTPLDAPVLAGSGRGF